MCKLIRTLPKSLIEPKREKEKVFWFVLSARTRAMILSSYEITISERSITIFISQPLSSHGNFISMQHSLSFLIIGIESIKVNDYYY
jgi:hypothetical protein